MTTRRSLFRIGLVTLFALAWSEPSEAGGEVIAVVVNEKNPAGVLGASDLRPIFQTTKTRWTNDVEAIPVNLPNEDALRIEFDRVVLGLDPDRVARYWQDRRIRGGARPQARDVPGRGAPRRRRAPRRRWLRPRRRRHRKRQGRRQDQRRQAPQPLKARP